MLTGKTAVVTGASRGIGRAIALRFAREGAHVIVNYNGSKDRAESVKEEIEKAGGSAQISQCDVSDFAMCESWIQSIIAEHGKMDILVNNAGITKDGLLMKMSESDFDQVIATNLKGTFHTIRFVSRQMLKQRSGRIINLSSVVGVAGNAGQANYAASKAGLIGFTKSVAREVAARGVRVNAIAPGFIESDMTDAIPEKMKDAMIAQVPMKRIGQAEEVAEVAAFLASQEYLTGQTIAIDGGMTMQ